MVVGPSTIEPPLNNIVLYTRVYSSIVVGTPTIGSLLNNIVSRVEQSQHEEVYWRSHID